LGSDILRLENVSAGYEEDLAIIKNINLRVGEGELIAVVGANGAGKSTLLKTIYGFLKPFTGRIFLKEKDITGMEPHELKKAGLAYIPQDLRPFREMTVEENLMLGLWVSRDKKEIQQRLQWAYDLFPNLYRKRNQKASLLSGGEAKMLDIARGLMIRPSLLLIDEPSVGLSPVIAEDVYRSILRLNKDFDITVLLVDQNVKRAIEISRYVYYMENGEIRYHGPSEEALNMMDKIVEASLLGDLIKF
jgi:branched-chain amino acid transport system ATP-binding protein